MFFEDFLISVPSKKESTEKKCCHCGEPSKEKVCLECQKKCVEQVMPQLEEVELD